MRKIKFRAWCTHIGDWGGSTPSTLNRLISDPKNSRLSIKMLEDDFIWMQYIGVLDKNGKEIYEGDIVKFNPEENTFYRIHQRNNDKEIKQTLYSEVVFEEGCFTFEWQYGWEGKEIDFKDTEVVGNIYENLKLLESADDR